MLKVRGRRKEEYALLRSSWVWQGTEGIMINHLSTVILTIILMKWQQEEVEEDVFQSESVFLGRDCLSLWREDKRMPILLS